LRQANFYRNFNVFLTVVVILLGIFVVGRSYYISSRGGRTVNSPDQDAVIDSTLINTIDGLEREIEDKRGFVFYVKEDPLKLSRVVIDTAHLSSEGKFKEKEEDRLIRLSATIITANDEPRAVIKYRNKSHIVQIGDAVGDRYKVLDIKPKRVRMSDGVREFELVTIPAQAEEQSQSAQSGFNQASSGYGSIPSEY
jgi:hypothetical protein